MSKPSEQNPTSGPAKTADPMPTNRNPAEPRGERKDFRETGQEADPDSTKDVIKAPAKDGVKPPLHAAKGNGDVS